MRSKRSLPAVGRNDTGWGVSWVDLANDGRQDLVLANGAIPVTNVKKDARPVQVLENMGGGRLRRRVGGRRARSRAARQRTRGRRGGLRQRRAHGRGDQLDRRQADPAPQHRRARVTGSTVSLAPLAPGARVTAVLPDGRRLVREVRSGAATSRPRIRASTSGSARRRRLKELIVRWPDGKITRRTGVAADRILTVTPMNEGAFRVCNDRASQPRRLAVEAGETVDGQLPRLGRRHRAAGEVIVLPRAWGPNAVRIHCRS